jgi:hypothetical protein
MYPPFSPFDLRVDSGGFDPFEEKRVIRRSAPEALRLIPPPPGAPYALYVATRPPDLREPVTSRGPVAILRFLRGLRFGPQV